MSAQEMKPDFDAERRAFELLQWVPYSLPTDFDEDLAAECYYTRTQKKRSDAALNAWDKEHPYERSEELNAFHELERLGVYTQADFFSPFKAKDGYYAKRLKEHLSARKPDRAPSTARPHRRLRGHRPL